MGELAELKYRCACPACHKTRLHEAAPEMLEVLRWINRKGGFGLEVHERIDTVLAKLDPRPPLTDRSTA